MDIYSNTIPSQSLVVTVAIASPFLKEIPMVAVYNEQLFFSARSMCRRPPFTIRLDVSGLVLVCTSYILCAAY